MKAEKRTKEQLIHELAAMRQRVAELEQLDNERKRAEEVLRKSEERYRSILDNIEDGYFELDLAGNFTFFNDSLCRELGYSQEEMMGMNNRQSWIKRMLKKYIRRSIEYTPRGNLIKHTIGSSQERMAQR